MPCQYFDPTYLLYPKLQIKLTQRLEQLHHLPGEDDHADLLKDGRADCAPLSVRVADLLRPCSLWPGST